MTEALETLVPYVTCRNGEEADSALSLCTRRGKDGMAHLGYVDESFHDRDTHGVLWSRVSQAIGVDRQPVGSPSWKLVHPARQRETMLRLRCQVCVRTAKGVFSAKHPGNPGVLFMESAGPGLDRPVRTAQPPVCVEHAVAAARRCPHLVSTGHVAMLVTRQRLYGVLGTPYRRTAGGVRAVSGTDTPVPYGDSRLSWFLASQLVRELIEYEVVELKDLVHTA